MRIPSSKPEHSARPPPARADDVLRMVLYFDVFRHPLRVDELDALCGPGAQAGLAEAERCGQIGREGRWVFRAGRVGDLAGRKARSAEAERQWPRARRAAAFLAGFPWVRGVFVTGALSKQSATREGDVDFLLLVEPGRVWSVKSALQVIRRALPSVAREAMCTNYLIGMDALDLPEQSMYHAVELATAIPMYGPAACTAFLEANRWARACVPGLEFSLDRAKAAADAPPSAGRSIAERLAPRRLETAGAKLISELWERRYGWLPESERARRFQRGPGVATNHLHDFSAWVNAEYRSRCLAVGVADP